MAKKKSLVWLNCSESELEPQVSVWLQKINLSNSIIFLEGEMGSGKSTFARALLKVLAPQAVTQGSPTFPLIQVYLSQEGHAFYHVDLYRLKSEAELLDSGLETQIEEQGATVCIEWSSLFPKAFSYWLDPAQKRRKNVFFIRITSDLKNQTRSYFIEKI